MDIVDTNEDINILMKDYEEKKKRYKSNPILTKYEKSRILSERSSQIISGCPIFISNPENYDNAYQIASKELEQNLIPFIIKRPYGNEYEYWKLKDLNN
jgi:DNA-directed RNA polymerase subunit K/omega